MMTPLEIVQRQPAGRRSLLAMRRDYIGARRWSAEDWYRAWQSRDLPAQVEEAARWTAADRVAR